MGERKIGGEHSAFRPVEHRVEQQHQAQHEGPKPDGLHNSPPPAPHLAPPIHEQPGRAPAPGLRDAPKLPPEQSAPVDTFKKLTPLERAPAASHDSDSGVSSTGSLSGRESVDIFGSEHEVWHDAVEHDAVEPDHDDVYFDASDGQPTVTPSEVVESGSVSPVEMDGWVEVQSPSVSSELEKSKLDKFWSNILESPIDKSRGNMDLSGIPLERRKSVSEVVYALNEFVNSELSAEGYQKFIDKLQEFKSSAVAESEKAFIQENIDYLKTLTPGEAIENPKWPVFEYLSKAAINKTSPEIVVISDRIEALTSKKDISMAEVVSELRKLKADPEISASQKSFIDEMMKHYQALELSDRMQKTLVATLIFDEFGFPSAEETFFDKEWISSSKVEQELAELPKQIGEIEKKAALELRTEFTPEENNEIGKLQAKLISLEQMVGISDSVTKDISRIKKENGLKATDKAIEQMRELQAKTKTAETSENQNLKDQQYIQEQIDLLEAVQMVRELNALNILEERSHDELMQKIRNLLNTCSGVEVSQYLNKVLLAEEKRSSVVEALQKAGRDYLENPGILSLPPQFMYVALKELLKSQVSEPSKTLTDFLKITLKLNRAEAIEKASKQLREKQEALKADSKEFRRLEFEKNALKILADKQFLDKYKSWEKQIVDYEVLSANGEAYIEKSKGDLEANKIEITDAKKIFEMSSRDASKDIEKFNKKSRDILKSQEELREKLFAVLNDDSVFSKDIEQPLSKLLQYGDELKVFAGSNEAQSLIERARLLEKYNQTVTDIKSIYEIEKSQLSPSAQSTFEEFFASRFVSERNVEMLDAKRIELKIKELTGSQDKIAENEVALAKSTKELSDFEQSFAANQHEKWSNFYERQKYGMIADEVTKQTYEVSREIHLAKKDRAEILAKPESQRKEVERTRLEQLDEKIGTLESTGDAKKDLESVNKLLLQKYKLEKKAVLSDKDKARILEISNLLGSLTEKKAQLMQTFNTTMRYMRDMDLKGVKAYPERGYLSSMSASLRDVLHVDFYGDYKRPTNEYYLDNLMRREGYTALESMDALISEFKSIDDKSVTLRQLTDLIGDIYKIAQDNPAVAEAVAGDAGHVLAQLTAGGGVAGTTLAATLGRLRAERYTRDRLVGGLTEGEGAPHFDQGIPPELLGLIAALQKAPYILGAAKGAVGGNLGGMGGHFLAAEIPVLSQILGAGGGLIQTAIEKRTAKSAPRDAEKFIDAALTLYKTGSIKEAWKGFFEAKAIKDLAGTSRALKEYGFLQNLKDLVTLKDFRRWWNNSSGKERALRIFGQGIVPIGMVAAAVGLTIFTGGVALIPIIISAVGSMAGAFAVNRGAKYAADVAFHDTDDKINNARNSDALERDFKKNKVFEDMLGSYVSNLGIADKPENLQSLRRELCVDMGKHLAAAMKEAGPNANQTELEASLERIISSSNAERKKKLAQELQEKLKEDQVPGNSIIEGQDPLAVINDIERILLEPNPAVVEDSGASAYPVWSSDFRDQATKG